VYGSIRYAYIPILNMEQGCIPLLLQQSDTARTYSDYSGPRGGVAA